MENEQRKLLMDRLGAAVRRQRETFKVLQAAREALDEAQDQHNQADEDESIAIRDITAAVEADITTPEELGRPAAGLVTAQGFFAMAVEDARVSFAPADSGVVVVQSPVTPLFVA